MGKNRIKKYTLPCVKSLESSTVNSSLETVGSGRGQPPYRRQALLDLPALAGHCAVPGLEVVGGLGLHPVCLATARRYGSKREVLLV